MPFLGTRGAGSNRAFGYAGAAKPNQVTGLTATDFGTARAFNNGRIDLSWTAPGNNGATISGYKIERSTDNSTYSTLVASTGTSATTYSDTSLTSSQIYYYKVSAINTVGTGDASTASSATATTVPQAPVVNAANVGTGRAYNNGAATITATGGATGGKAISSYTATSSPGSFTATSGSPLTVTGLQSATSYTFNVTATNANGTSTATTSGSITATTVPQAPTIGTASDGGTGTTATVTYTAGATGGAAVSVFTTTSSPGSLTGTGASPITVSGLTTGTAYTFAVTATNANGTSSASAASNSVTILPPPVGTNWTLGTLPATTTAMTTSINSARFYFQQRSSIQTVWSSSNGLTWTSVGSVLGLTLYAPLGGSAAMGDMAIFSTLNSDSSKGAYTTNGGTSWSDINTSAWGTSVWSGAAAADGTAFVMVKQLSATNTAFSTNGSTWTNNGSLAAGDYYSITYSADTGTYKWQTTRTDFISYFATSYNGSWTQRTHSNGGRIVGANWGRGSVFMNYQNGGTTGLTTNGTSDVTNPITFPFTVGGQRAVAYASTPARWICINNGPQIGTSDNNGASWTIRTKPTGFNNADNIVYNSTINRAIISAEGQTAIAYSG